MAPAIAFAEPATVNTAGTWTAADALWASGFGLWLLQGNKSVAATTDLQTSPDTTTWTMRTMPSTATYRGLAYASTLGTIGRAVSVGNGVAAWSDDGVTWTAATSLPEANNWIDVKWWPSKGLFVACADSGVHRMMTSPDGKSWTVRTAASALAWAGLNVSSTTAVCVAFSTVTGTQFVQTSTDGTTWTMQTHTAIATRRGLVGGAASRISVGYNPTADMFLITGTDAGSTTSAWRSTDSGVTWTVSSAIPTISGTTNRGYLWLASVSTWYMPCADAHYGTSTDGITWTVSSLPGGVTHAGYTPMGFDGAGKLVGGSTLGFDTALLVTVTQLDSVSPSRGTRAGGTVVTLHGVGLAVMTSATFDGIAATNFVPAANGLTATCLTPAHAVGDVTVAVS